MARQSIRGDEVIAISPELIRELAPAEGIERIERALEIKETVMMGLRLSRGIVQEEFRRRFGVGIADIYGPTVQDLEGLGLLEQSAQAVLLTRRGRLLSNEVFVRLFA